MKSQAELVGYRISCWLGMWYPLLRCARIACASIFVFNLGALAGLHAQVPAWAVPTPAGDHLHAAGEISAGSSRLDAQSLDVQFVFDRANAERAAQGLAPLSWSSELASAASTHAQLMALKANSELSHRYPGEPDLMTRAGSAGARFSSIAENIAQGGSAHQIAQAWMQSIPHRTNILDPRMNALGVAVFASGGTLYAVEDFAATVPALSAETIEQRVTAELLALGVPAATDAAGSSVKLRDETRRNCPQAEGMLEGSTPGTMVRWQGADLALPQPLVDLVHSRHFGASAVGACAPVGSTGAGFANYRVAVLLF